MIEKNKKYIALIVTVVYCSLFYKLVPILGNVYLMFSIIPLILWIIYYGFWIALVVQIVLLINRFIAFHILDIVLIPKDEIANIIGTLANVGVIGVIGYIKKIKDKLTETTSTLNQNRSELFNKNKELSELNKIIKNKEQRLNTLIQNQGEGFGITDLEETFLFANSAACKIFGVELGKLKNRKIWEFLDENEWNKISQQTKNRKANKTNSYEVTIFLPHNIKKHILVTASPDYDKNNKIIGTIGVFRDITELKKVEHEIKNKNIELTKYFTAIEQNFLAIFYTNTEAEIEYANPQFETLTGYSTLEVLGKTPKILNSGKTPQKSIIELWDTIKKGKAWIGEFINKKKDGSIYYDKSFISPVLDSNTKKILGYVAVKEDITKIKEEEEKLNQLNNELTVLLSATQNQKNIIEESHNQINDSIVYASKIQTALLPKIELKNNFKDYFVLFKPRDTVSGDFYWIKNMNNYTIIAAVDSTGHGVPGAFMSMLGIAFLNEIVSSRNVTNTGDIVNKLRDKVKKSLKQTEKNNKNKDGFDLAIYTLNRDNNNLNFTGAQSSVVIIRSNKLEKLDYNGKCKIRTNRTFDLYEIKGDRQPVGVYVNEKPFETISLKLIPGDCIYTFSDGYIDQFGGELGQKFKSKNLFNLLLNICDKPMKEQKQILLDTLLDWKGEKCEQVDDILVIGVKIYQPLFNSRIK